MNESTLKTDEKKKSKILLVDDEPGLRNAVKTFLEDEGFEITIAVDGEDGWEKAQKLFPDLIISDVMMPRCNGYGLLEKIREDERLSGTPVIFLEFYFLRPQEMRLHITLINFLYLID